MKKYDELTARLLERRDQYVAAQAAKRKRMLQVALPMSGGLLAAVIGIALWQGGVFAPAQLPVEAPNESTSTTDTTADTTTTTTEKSTIPTTTEPYILVGGEDDGEDDYEGFEFSMPSVKISRISPALKEKMKEYSDVNAVYQVLVGVTLSLEDIDEFYIHISNNEGYQSLKKQCEDADKALEEVCKLIDNCEYLEDDPRRDELWQKRNDAEKKYNELCEKLTNLEFELRKKFLDDYTQKQISYAARYSKLEPIGKTEPLSGFDRYGTDYYMELTADAINELFDRKGYYFKLTTDKEPEFVNH